MNGTLVFDPLVGWPVIWTLAAVAAVLVALALWRGLSGWWLRALGAAVVLAALANPAIQHEDRAPLSDIVILAVDESASQKLGDRPEQAARAVAEVQAEVAAIPNTELRIVRFGDGADNAGTLAMTALAEALAEEPRARVAGAILISDGQVHDLQLAPNMPAPLHLLMTGHAADWDRRLIVKNAPAFAILGEPVTLTLRIEDQGRVPAGQGGMAELTIAVDADAPQTYQVPVGQDLDLPVTLPHGGQNVLQFTVATAAGEITDRNNSAIVQMNGVRDRLRVLLVSGEPHAGERVWRNLLKSDPSVDLVHFTILRPPEKQDGVPVDELSLIAFPTRELFIEKIDEFDLIIFDRYRMRGILPMSYLQNVADYVRRGGTVLVAAGPEFGAVDSLWRSPLAEVLPVDPTTRVVEGGFRPELTDLGRRHPVTEGLDKLAPEGGWGRWFRIMEVVPKSGQVVMQGPGNRPLLVLDRVGEGRVAVLASDQAWLWGRGFEGGGPQLELLRRLAHWMLKEPELEEESLTATVKGQVLTITRRTVAEDPPGPVTITAPDGTTTALDLVQGDPGKWQADWQAPSIGLYRLEQGKLTRVVAVGPQAPKEFAETIATPAHLAPILAATNGGSLRAEEGAPDIRTVREGRPAAGRGWLGITPRGAYVTQDVSIAALLPGWLYLLLAAALAVAAWLIEGRRGSRRVA
ncbi:MAG: glutamine amidotransferase [Paracoccaceae bacterium]